MSRRPFRFGVVSAMARSGGAWAQEARRAEASGYDVLLAQDRSSPLLSPMPGLAAAEAATRGLRVYTFVLSAGWRNPTLLAQECATLDLLSGGRFELGLGAGVGGEDAQRVGLPAGSPGERVARLANDLEAIKTHLEDRGARPPVLVAAGGRRGLALAAREADIVALGVRPDEGEALAGRIGWLEDEAGGVSRIWSSASTSWRSSSTGAGVGALRPGRRQPRARGIPVRARRHHRRHARASPGTA